MNEWMNEWRTWRNGHPIQNRWMSEWNEQGQFSHRTWIGSQLGLQTRPRMLTWFKTGMHLINIYINFHGASQLWLHQWKSALALDFLNFGVMDEIYVRRISLSQGGSHIMYTYSVSGMQANNRIFSPCSRRSINSVLQSKSPNCFLPKSQTFCGNHKREQGDKY